MARTIRAAIWCRRVGSLGQNSGGVAEESQPLITPRAASASMATQAGSLAGASPKRGPHGPGGGGGFGGGLAEGDGVAEGGAGAYSTAPMSHRPPTGCGRGVPRWSVTMVQRPRGIRSAAGLLGTRLWVSVGPPLAARVGTRTVSMAPGRMRSPVAFIGHPVLLPVRLSPCETMFPLSQSLAVCPLRLPTTMLAWRLTVPWLVLRPPPGDAATFPTIVAWRTVAVAAWTVIPPYVRL